MRAKTIYRILEPSVFDIIDINIPFFNSSHIWRTFSFRLKKGPLIKKINSYVLSCIDFRDSLSNYDLIWVDKGVFLKPEVVRRIKEITKKLIHFTPDMAFYENRSLL